MSAIGVAAILRVWSKSKHGGSSDIEVMVRNVNWEGQFERTGIICRATCRITSDPSVLDPITEKDSRFQGMQIALSNMRLQNVVTGHRWMEHMVSETRASWLYHFRVGPSSYVENVLLARCKIQVKPPLLKFVRTPAGVVMTGIWI